MIVGVDNLDTYSILNAVKKNRIKQSPLQTRPLSNLLEEAFKHLCDLFLSLFAISQHNCDNSIDRQYSITLLGMIVNPYLEATRQSMNFEHLWKHIENENTYRQDINSIDHREALCVSWFTVNNLLKHYNKFESFFIKKGFARWSREKKLKSNHEKIKWYENQRHRALNSDKMSWGVDAQANGLGGRPGTTYITGLLKNSGYAAQKSAVKVSLFCGMTFGDEALPPLIIIPATGITRRIEMELIRRMHQVEGQYGHVSRKRFNAMIAASAKGSMNSTILNSYMQFITQLFPGCADKDKQQILWKLDNGVGHDDSQFLFNRHMGSMSTQAYQTHLKEHKKWMSFLHSLNH